VEQQGAVSPLSALTQVGLALRFGVVMDDLYDLGLWKSCKGLSVTFKSKPQYEGGTYDYPVAMLAEELDYSPVTLQRAICQPDTTSVQNWLRSRAADWFGDRSFAYTGSTAVITLLAADLTEVFSWSLRNVYPSKWSGPDLDATSNAVALETLELKHRGFL
jgi:phage tail-like protein